MPYGQCAMVYFDPPIKEIMIFQHIKIKCSPIKSEKIPGKGVFLSLQIILLKISKI